MRRNGTFGRVLLFCLSFCLTLPLSGCGTDPGASVPGRSVTSLTPYETALKDLDEVPGINAAPCGQVGLAGYDRCFASEEEIRTAVTVLAARLNWRPVNPGSELVCQEATDQHGRSCSLALDVAGTPTTIYGVEHTPQHRVVGVTRQQAP